MTLSRRSRSAAVASTVLLFAVALVPLACGDDSEDFNAACQAELLDGCGDECSSSADCAGGLYCNRESLTCAAACVAGEKESAYCDGEACLSNGQCADRPDRSVEGAGNAACAEKDLDGCGDDCKTTADCADGLYCSADTLTCRAACVAGEKESDFCNGEACESDGQCQGARDRSVEGKNTIKVGIGGATGGGDPGPDPINCIDVDVEFTPQTPSVVLLIDRSGSMDDRANYGVAVDEAIAAGDYAKWNCGDNYDWRWNVVRNVLLNPESGIVKPLEDRVRFGLSLYTRSNSSCPQLRTVDVALNNQEAMLSEFKCSNLGGDTPTRESLTATAESLAAFDEPGPKVIVLATDGEPDTCECPNWTNSAGPGCGQSGRAAEEQDNVVAEAKRIHDELGITVEVIDVSGQSADLTQHLEKVAQAGGGSRYDGEKPADLIDAFETIINGARSCVIDLDGEIASGKESSGTVLLDGKKLPYDDADGWRVKSPTQLELLGSACESLKSAGSLEVTFPCGTFVLPPR